MTKDTKYVIYCHYEKDYIFASSCFPCEECPDNYKISVNNFEKLLQEWLQEEAE